MADTSQWSGLVNGMRSSLTRGVSPLTVPLVDPARLPLVQTIDQWPAKRLFGLALTCTLMGIGGLTPPLARQVANWPEDRQLPRRMVLLDAVAWLAEAGTATAKMAP